MAEIKCENDIKISWDLFLSVLLVPTSDEKPSKPQRSKCFSSLLRVSNFVSLKGYFNRTLFKKCTYTRKTSFSRLRFRRFVCFSRTLFTQNKSGISCFLYPTCLWSVCIGIGLVSLSLSKWETASIDVIITELSLRLSIYCKASFQGWWFDLMKDRGTSVKLLDISWQLGWN